MRTLNCLLFFAAAVAMSYGKGIISSSQDERQACVDCTGYIDRAFVLLAVIGGWGDLIMGYHIDNAYYQI